MSNELLLVGATVIGLAAIATAVRRFLILDAPAPSAPGLDRLVPGADPDRAGKIALRELQRSADARGSRDAA